MVIFVPGLSRAGQQNLSGRLLSVACPLACPQVGLGGANHREKLREDQPREVEHDSHRNFLGPPTPIDQVG